MKINFDLGKNRCYIPSGLGSRLIVVVRQKGKQTLGVQDFLKIQQLHSKVHLGYLNGFIMVLT